MTVRYMVGYNGDKRSKDALLLAVSMARTLRAELDIVCVLRSDDPHAQEYPPVGNVLPILRKQASSWLAEALETVRGVVPARTHTRVSPSIAGGLLKAAEDLDAALIVVGAASGSYTARFSVGPVTDALLHRSEVPVALAPKGFKGGPGIRTLYAGVGIRPGAQQVLAHAQKAASHADLALELVSFVALDQIDGAPDEVTSAAEERLTRVASAVRSGDPVPVHVARGRSLARAVSGMEWKPDSVLMVGSSRLAGDRQIFLGATTGRILRHLSIPMIVLPLLPEREDEVRD